MTVAVFSSPARASAAARAMRPAVLREVRRRLAPALALLAAAGAVSAQPPHVPFVPTPPNVVDAMLELAAVGPDDYVIDLGSGDGRIVIAAAKKFGARGFGVELDGGLVNEARREAARQGVTGRVEFLERDLFVTDIDRATVVTMYLYSSVMMALRPRLLAELKPGTRVVSHDFGMENWRPDARVTVPVPDKPFGPPSSDVYLWIVPANAAGTWRWRAVVAGAPVEYEAALEQTFQMLEGSALAGGRRARVEAGRMRGDRISFTLVSEVAGRPVRHEFSGRVVGDVVKGTATIDGREETQWSATRVKRGKISQW